MLNALQVSTPQLEQLVAIARASGALGAKLTGGGGGGSIIALCDGDPARVVNAIRAAGFQALDVVIGGSDHGQ
jgi:hydroxymethylglutaryl-CoA reductase